MKETVDKILNLSHLTPAAKEAALLPNIERVHKIKSGLWIGYTQAQKALEKLEELFTLPSRSRMPNLLILAATNNGKSMIIEKFRRQHFPTINKDGCIENMPVLSIQMPMVPSIGSVSLTILQALGVPTARRLDSIVSEQMSLQLMAKTNIRMLIIDEFHNMLSAKPSTLRKLQNWLRFVGNQLKIPVVGAGTADAYRAIRTDPQLENRFHPFILPLWQDNKEFLQLLASFAASLPLHKSFDFLNPETAQYILKRTEGTIGEISTFLTAAAIAAIKTGEEAINSKTLTMAEYSGPTERRLRSENKAL